MAIHGSMAVGRRPIRPLRILLAIAAALAGGCAAPGAPPVVPEAALDSPPSIRAILQDPIEKDRPFRVEVVRVDAERRQLVLPGIRYLTRDCRLDVLCGGRMLGSVRVVGAWETMSVVEFISGGQGLEEVRPGDSLTCVPTRVPSWCRVY